MCVFCSSKLLFLAVHCWIWSCLQDWCSYELPKSGFLLYFNYLLYYFSVRGFIRLLLCAFWFPVVLSKQPTNTKRMSVLLFRSSTVSISPLLSADFLWFVLMSSDAHKQLSEWILLYKILIKMLSFTLFCLSHFCNNWLPTWEALSRHLHSVAWACSLHVRYLGDICKF